MLLSDRTESYTRPEADESFQSKFNEDLEKIMSIYPSGKTIEYVRNEQALLVAIAYGNEEIE